jgi:hypothetical protein
VSDNYDVDADLVLKKCLCKKVNKIGKSLVFVKLGRLSRQTKKKKAIAIKRRQES